MISKASDQISKLRVQPIFGDIGMSVQFIQSKIIRQMFEGDKKIYWTIIVWMFKAKIEMFALLSRSILRYNHGRHTTGIMMFIWTISMLLAFNSGDKIGYLLSFIPFGSPLLLINMSWMQFQEIIWFQTTSESIALWIGIFSFFQLIHVIRIYLEVGNKDDHMKRGASWIYMPFSRSKIISEFHVQCLIEPILIASIGYLIWINTGDMFFLILACTSGFCLFLQEFLDGSYRYLNSRF